MTNLVVLTGAGISKESGVPTFRDTGGLWHNHSVDEVATPEGFAANPDLVHAFYNERRRNMTDCEPNAAHRAIAELEARWEAENRGGFLLITQNIDDLHRRAGSKNILQMHGDITAVKCTACGTLSPQAGDCTAATPCPACGKTEVLRPHVVWFREMPLGLNTIEVVLDHTDIIVVVGTSGQVMPASLFPECVRRNGRPGTRRIEVNPDPTGNEAFTEVIAEAASTGVPRLVAELLATA